MGLQCQDSDLGFLQESPDNTNRQGYWGTWQAGAIMGWEGQRRHGIRETLWSLGTGGGPQGGAQGWPKLNKATNSEGDGRREACGLTPTFLGRDLGRKNEE